MEKAGTSMARKVKEKGRTTKGLPRAKVTREKASERMARKANPRKEQTMAKAKVTIDPRARENQISSALHAVNMATTQRTVGKINKCVQCPKAQTLSLVMQQWHNSQWFKGPHRRQLVPVSLI